jgi:threonine/homoserine/homoserine lactone efflux protein
MSAKRVSRAFVLSVLTSVVAKSHPEWNAMELLLAVTVFLVASFVGFLMEDE